MKADRVVRSTCPYCGVGCQIDLHVEDDRIFRVDAPFNAAPNHGRLCVKGRFGTDFVHHPSRLTVPLIRRTPQDAGITARLPPPVTNGGRRAGMRRSTWSPPACSTCAGATGRTASRRTRRAKATNEDNYLLQKYLRAVIGTNNVDHCARLCHAGSVAGLQLALGSSAMSNAIAEMPDLECFMVVGSNTAETHPVIATFLKQAVVRNGARLIVVDPRGTEMTRFAELWLRAAARPDRALFTAMAQVIVAEKLYNPAFIAARTEGFEAFAADLAGRTPEWAEAITGVPADDIRHAARIYAGAKAAAIYWGMGISQSTHGTENTLTLTNLALLCGHVGRPGTGLNPLRGQNNVQGCSDVGGAPAFYTAYQPVSDPAVRARFEVAWRVPLPATPGLTTTEMVDGILTGQVKGWYVMGENPLMSEPNLAHARHAVEHLAFFVAQDIFRNETNVYADVILPAASFAEHDGTFTNSDRRIQPVRQAVTPPGQARPDWEIIADLARRTVRQIANLPLTSAADQAIRADASALLAQWHYTGPADIWLELRQLTPDFGGISYARLEREGGVHWPCPSPEHPGTPFLFAERVPARARQVLDGGLRHRERAARRRLPVHPEHWPRPLSLARRHDDARLGAGRGLARVHRRATPRRCRPVRPGDR